jgi:hypothetical protein
VASPGARCATRSSTSNCDLAGGLCAALVSEAVPKRRQLGRAAAVLTEKIVGLAANELSKSASVGSNKISLYQKAISDAPLFG